ncbi:hypothetical protein ACVI3U_005024 [Sinorhizobium medicae]
MLSEGEIDVPLYVYDRLQQRAYAQFKVTAATAR